MNLERIDNVTVYSAALTTKITHIQNIVRGTLSAMYSPCTSLTVTCDHIIDDLRRERLSH